MDEAQLRAKLERIEALFAGAATKGEQMAANKVHGARAALCNDLYTARMSRAHNDANILAIGGRVVAFALADEIIALWLDTAFEGGRHKRREDLIMAIETAELRQP